nr:DUF1990 family protein [Leucobacter weissii]
MGGAPGTAPESPVWRPGQTRPFRRFEASTVVGHGDASWERVSQEVLDWKVKTRSGFAVDGARPASPGAEPMITVRFAGRVIREPVRVETVVETASRVGFSYRTLPGHPVSGEEAFIAHRDGDAVVLTIRSLTAAAPTQPWRALHPLLRIAQAIARRRYLRALR